MLLYSNHFVFGLDKPEVNNLFQNRKNITIQSDKGTEFVNATVQQYLKRQGVYFLSTHNPYVKGAVISDLIVI